MLGQGFLNTKRYSDWFSRLLWRYNSIRDHSKIDQLNPRKRSCRISGVWFLEPKLSHWSDWSECKTETLEGAEPIRNVLKSHNSLIILIDSFLKPAKAKSEEKDSVSESNSNILRMGIYRLILLLIRRKSVFIFSQLGLTFKNLFLVADNS